MAFLQARSLDVEACKLDNKSSFEMTQLMPMRCAGIHYPGTRARFCEVEGEVLVVRNFFLCRRLVGLAPAATSGATDQSSKGGLFRKRTSRETGLSGISHQLAVVRPRCLSD